MIIFGFPLDAIFLKIEEWNVWKEKSFIRELQKIGSASASASEMPKRFRYRLSRSKDQSRSVTEDVEQNSLKGREKMLELNSLTKIDAVIHYAVSTIRC